MGPMNGPEDPHPVTILSACKLLGVPLPANAVCKNPPSFYVGADVLSGEPEFIKAALGKYLPKAFKDDEEFDKKWKQFNRKFKSQNCLTFTNTDFTVYFCDWVLYAQDRGFSHNDYFDYELYNKEPDIRDTFINFGYGLRLFNSCKERPYLKVFREKAQFNTTFKKYVHRDWVDAKTCTFEEFKAFCERHDKFFAKPTVGTGGAGARVIETASAPLEELFEICQAEKMMVEEIVQQHESLAEFNRGSLNTARVITLVCADGVPRIIFSVVRFGREGIVVDNFHGGGVGAILDPETGKIITNAINRVHDKVEEHPDSHKKFLGFQFPEWEKVKAAVLDAATMVPQMRSIGWDVSVTADGEVEFIEGNSKSGFHLPQEPDQTGRRYKYEKFLKEIEELKGIKIKEPGPVVLVEDRVEKKPAKKKSSTSKNTSSAKKSTVSSEKKTSTGSKAKQQKKDQSLIKKVKRFIKKLF